MTRVTLDRSGGEPNSRDPSVYAKLLRLAKLAVPNTCILIARRDSEAKKLSSVVSLDEPWSHLATLETSHRLWQRLVEERSFAIEDAGQEALWQSLRVGAIAATAIIENGEPVGLMAAVTRHPRPWHPLEVAALVDLAECAQTEFQLRDQLAQTSTDRTSAIIDNVSRIVENLPRGAVAVFDQELRCVAVDGSLIRQGTLPREQMIGRSIVDVASLGRTDEQKAILEDVCRRTLAGDSCTLDSPVGAQVFELHTTPIRDAGGVIQAGVILAIEQTETRKAAAELYRSAQVYRAMVENMPSGGIFMFDKDLQYVRASGPLAPEESVDSEVFGERVTASGLARPEVWQLASEALEGKSARKELQLRGQFYELTAVPIREHDKSISHALLLFYDVTDRKRSAEHELSLDPLTAVLNRRGGEAALAQEDAKRRRGGQPLCIAMIDIDHFKNVNDTHGHAAGDQVLKSVAAIIRSQIRASDHFARWGGEEFLVVLPGALAGATVFAERARRAVHDARGPVPVTISIGLVQVAEEEDLTQALARADAKLYEAKHGGRNRVVF
jgi:diguanylate cyclase (GGDEF)-like protein